MVDEKVRLIMGSLLHDTGKVIYRQGDDRRNHSISGYDYLKEETNLTDSEILDCVRYHHASLLKRAVGLKENSLAYIVYLADNIAAFSDRRKKDESEDRGFERSLPLQSVFNILNGNHQEKYYHPGNMDPKNGINDPGDEKIPFSESFYTTVKVQITENLKGMDWNSEYLNSLLTVLEANLSYVPSSTSKEELADISLFDHVKLTAAIASCIYDYLNENHLNYKETLFSKETEFYETEAFLFCSLDISGIQKFIYTIASKNALRTLRARSFYLEIMMEHIIDTLLERLELSRANLIYSGGGHCYLLLANTQKTREVLNTFQKELQSWFLKYFRTELFVAFGYSVCSGNTFRNVPEGSYANMFRQASAGISKAKLHRYTAEEIIALNQYRADDYTRECKVCKRIGQVDEKGVCPLCRKIEALSGNVLYDTFFSIVLEGEQEGLPLPGGYRMVTDDEKSLKKRMEEDIYYVRTYAKNAMYTGKHIATKLWVGDYTTGDTFEAFAEQAEGIKRIAVMRADVDNLGQAFVSGFSQGKSTLSRTATLSRQLSVFFKYYIRDILENGEYSIQGEDSKRKRKVTIVYSGGDDVFLVGSWNDVIEATIDLSEKFKRYTQGTLSISAGIGIYECSYPIAAIAGETGRMEEESKKSPNKKSITLMEDGEDHKVDELDKPLSDGTYEWDEFKNEVLEQKYRAVQEFFRNVDERGMSFLYRMLELIRNQDQNLKQDKKNKIEFARFLYLLSRLEPKEEGTQKEQYRRFAEKMYRWIQSEKDCRQLKTALNLYAYMHRERGENYADK